MAEKFELNTEELDNVAGGKKTEHVEQEDVNQEVNNKKSNQLNNVNGKNTQHVTQSNHVTKNKGDVVIKSPVEIHDINNGTFNMNF